MVVFSYEVFIMGYYDQLRKERIQTIKKEMAELGSEREVKLSLYVSQKCNALGLTPSKFAEYMRQLAQEGILTMNVQDDTLRSSFIKKGENNGN